MIQILSIKTPLRITAIIVLLVITKSVFAQTYFKKPQRGFTSENPASNWEQALVSGNGTMGALVYGNVYNETIGISHALLYLPLTTTGTYVNQGERLPEIRDYLLTGKYKEAGNVISEMRKTAGYSDARDPFIPAFDLKIEQQGTTWKEYQRAVDFQTGEATVVWRDEEAVFQRKVFVSRPDSMVVVAISGSKKINCSIYLQGLPVTSRKDSVIVSTGFASVNSGQANGWLSFEALYRNKNPYSRFEGYYGTAKVINKGGTVRYESNKAIVENADEVIILIKTEPVVRFTGQEKTSIQQFITSKSTDYETLLTRHAKVHGALFNTVKLDLGASEKDVSLPSEQLFKKSVGEETPLALIERAFDAGRYNIISSMGTNPPNLIGLWSGLWTSPWSGSFTTNGNLQTAMAFVLQGNTPSLMQAYFNYNERMMDGYRRSAKELFNARGIHIPAQMTTTPLETDFSPAYPHSYWTGGAGWAAQFYYDYYQYTNDRKFLSEKGYPFMKEAALFLEDFLTIEKDGKYVFIPSYSPENSPGNHSTVPSSVNATMDVMVTKQLLRNCIKAATLLKTDAVEIKRWEAILAKMPAYQISKEGALREWLWPGEEENYKHRHASHLFALYNETPPEFENDSLKKAAGKTIDFRYDFHSKGAGFMAFGIAHLGWAAAHIGNATQASAVVNFLAKNYWSDGMASYHNKGALFNMDISGGYPYLIAQCLVQSKTGFISLLPALPETWAQGSIKGLLLHGNIQLKELSWTKNGLTVVLLANETTKIKLKAPSNIKMLNGKALNNKGQDKQTYLANLIKGVETKIVISY